MPLIEPTTKLMVLMFTDLAGSVDLKTRLGATAYARIISRHDQLFKQIIGAITGSSTIKDTGDGFLVRFETASDAVQAALRFQHAIHQEPWQPEPVRVRIGLHIGQVAELEKEDATGLPKLVGLAADIAARVMDLAVPGQILMTRTPFDDGRQYIREHPPVDGETPLLKWMAHGPYLFKGSDEPMDVFEVGAVGIAPLKEPPDSNKAKRAIRPGEEELFGWRPAIGLQVPARDGWMVERKLGEGGFGEVWLARHQRTRDVRVFKFCFDGDRLRSFKREMTLFRLLREALGDRKDIAKLWEVRLDKPPFYLESAFSKEGDLGDWMANQGGPLKLPLDQRLELIAKIADAVAAAHSVGVLHKDIKPANILVHIDPDGAVQPMLADFGIGVATDRTQLEGRNITVVGFTEGLLDGNESSRTGTRLYSPPELLTGKAFTTKGDVFALGVMLYQFIVGDLSRPLAHGWEREVTDPLLREDVAACVAGNEEERLGSAGELAKRLRRLPQRRKERARQRAFRVVVATAAALALLAIVAGALVFRERGLRDEADQQRDAATTARNLAESRRAEIASLLAESRSRLVRLYVEKGWRNDGRDLTQSLLWFVEALRNESDDVREQWLHRLRIGTSMQQIPTLGVAWVSPEFGYGVSYNADASHAAMFVSDDRVVVVELASGKTTTLPAQLGKFTALSADATRLVTVTALGTVQAWNTATAQPISPAIGLGPDETPRRIELNGAGDRLLMIGEGATAHLRKVDDLSLIARLTHESNILDARFSGDGRLLATAGRDRKVKIWDAVTGKPVGNPIEHSDEVIRVAFTADNARLFVGCANGAVRIYHTKDWTLAETLELGAMLDMAIDPSGLHVAATVRTKGTIVWDLVRGRAWSTPVLTGLPPLFLKFTRDGKSLLAGTPDGQLWRIDQHLPAAMFPMRIGSRPSISMTTSDDLLTFDGYSMRSWQWRGAGAPQTSMQVRPMPRPGEAPGRDAPRPRRDRLTTPVPYGAPMVDAEAPMLIHQIALDAAGKRIAVGSAGNQANVWTLGEKTAPVMLPFKDSVEFVELTRDGRQLLTVTDAGVAQVWDVTASSPTPRTLPSPALVQSARFFPDGKRVLIGDDDGDASIWDVAGLRRVVGPISGEGIAEVMPDETGSRFLVRYNLSFQLFDAATGAVATPKVEFKEQIVYVAVASTGRIATASRDGHVRIHSPDGKEISRSEVLPALTQVGFSPDGTRFAAHYADGARVFDTQSAKPVSEVMSHESFVIDLAFSSDGRLLATAADDRTARIWDAATGAPVSPWLRHGSPVHLVRFLPDGGVLTVSGDTAAIWPMPTDSRPAAELADLVQLQAGAAIDSTLSVVPLTWEQSTDRVKRLWKRGQ